MPKRIEGTNAALDRVVEKLEKMNVRERRAFVQQLVEKHAPEEAEREYAQKQTQRARILAVLRAYPRPSYASLAALALGDASLGNRIKIRGHLARMKVAELVKEVDDGLWEAAPAKKTPKVKKTSEPK